tara:strand:- start:15330 stop:16697 length:1368 start_codon:yes stop_codon:yes gene_type:complete
MNEISYQLASFAQQSSFDDLSEEVRERMKVLLLDAIACAIGSLRSEPIQFLKDQVEEFGGSSITSLIGGGKTAPDRAAFFNAALIRYLDFNDGYMGSLATCHPSDQLGAILAASEYADLSGSDFMTALALAYEIQCRFCEFCSYEDKGFDQALAISYSTAAGVSRALSLDIEKTANAIGISGASQNPFLIVRAGRISHWKGFSTANTCANALHATFLAMRGVTGPPEIFEGPLGLFDSITGPFDINLADTSIKKVLEISLKKFNAGIHSQTAIEGVIELKEENDLIPEEISEVEIEIYQRAYFIMGGGKGGDKHDVQNKETADHSLPYVLAAALIDNNVMPEQFEEKRILEEDVQSLLRCVKVSNSEALTNRYPQESPVTIKITNKENKIFKKEKSSYEGHYSKPMEWSTVVEKFGFLCDDFISAQMKEEIIDAVSRIDAIQVSDLTSIISKMKI